MKIGFTERGDAGLDFSWVKNLPMVNGAVLITKSCNDAFIGRAMEAFEKGYKFLAHLGCTGWGGTVIEPNVPRYETQLDQVASFVRAGFPKEKVVLRIDPIWPTKSGIERVLDVLSYLDEKKELDGIRIRISILDEYRHVKERMRKVGFSPVYGDFFYPSKERVLAMSKALEKTGHVFECCAEPELTASCFIQRGCLSETDLELMGLKMRKTPSTNPQNRKGCLCLGYKVELLDGKRAQCPHGCMYCYWK